MIPGLMTRALGGTAGLTLGPLLPMQSHRCTWPASSSPGHCRPGPPLEASWLANFFDFSEGDQDRTVPYFHLVNPLRAGSQQTHVDMKSVRVQAENITHSRNLSRGNVVIQALEEMEWQTRVNGDVESSSHRKMAPFLDFKVNEKRWCLQSLEKDGTLAEALWQE